MCITVFTFNMNKDKYIDLHYALKDQINFIPIEPNEYFLNIDTFRIYSKRLNRYLKISNNLINLKTNSLKPVYKYNRIICFIKNGLIDSMNNINDNRYLAIQDKNNYIWVSVKDYKLKENKDNLQQVWLNHPELLERDGYFDEGVIPFKGYPGYYIVPTTKGTVALNPLTKEAIFTYSKVKLNIQKCFRNKSDKIEEKLTLNPRLVGRRLLMLNRAIGYLTIKLPERYKSNNKKLCDIIDNLDVDHIDGNPSNNNIDNLQYLTRKENLVKKLDQGFDPRVFQSTWKSPSGEIFNFRSLRLAAEIIGCNLTALMKFHKGWRSSGNYFLKWELLSDKIKNKNFKFYDFFISKKISLENLTSYRKGVIVFRTDNNKNYISIYSNMKDFCNKMNLNKSGIETHLGINGPLEPYKGMIIFPLIYEKILRESYFLETFFSKK